MEDNPITRVSTPGYKDTDVSTIDREVQLAPTDKYISGYKIQHPAKKHENGSLVLRTAKIPGFPWVIIRCTRHPITLFQK